MVARTKPVGRPTSQSNLTKQKVTVKTKQVPSVLPQTPITLSEAPSRSATPGDGDSIESIGSLMGSPEPLRLSRRCYRMEGLDDSSPDTNALPNQSDLPASVVPLIALPPRQDMDDEPLQTEQTGIFSKIFGGLPSFARRSLQGFSLTPRAPSTSTSSIPIKVTVERLFRSLEGAVTYEDILKKRLVAKLGSDAMLTDSWFTDAARDGAAMDRLVLLRFSGNSEVERYEFIPYSECRARYPVELCDYLSNGFDWGSTPTKDNGIQPIATPECASEEVHHLKETPLGTTLGVIQLPENSIDAPLKIRGGCHNNMSSTSHSLLGSAVTPLTLPQAREVVCKATEGSMQSPDPRDAIGEKIENTKTNVEENEGVAV